MRFAQRVTHTRMASCEDALARPAHARRIQLQVHQLVHVLDDQHVAVQLHDALILHQRERGQLAPAVVEADVVGEVFRHRGEEVGHALLGDAARVERRVSVGWEGVRVQRHERVFRARLFEGVVQGQEAWEVGCVCDEGGPYYEQTSVLVGREIRPGTKVPFVAGVTRSAAG